MAIITGPEDDEVMVASDVLPIAVVDVNNPAEPETDTEVIVEAVAPPSRTFAVPATVTVLSFVKPLSVNEFKVVESAVVPAVVIARVVISALVSVNVIAPLVEFPDKVKFKVVLVGADKLLVITTVEG